MNLLKLYDLFIEPVIAFALPAFCILCENKLESNRKIVCPTCFDQLPPLPEEFINVLIKEIDQPCFDTLHIKFQFADQFQKLIYSFKYQRTLTLAKYFAEAIAPILNKSGFDLITSIPLNPIKEKERGYNQSALIANELGQLLEIPVDNLLIKRIKNTPSQTKFNREQRIKNVMDAFDCEADLSDQKIILIDDIITTGSTMNACAHVLKRQAATNVTAVALATPMDILQQNLEKDMVELNSF